MIVKNWDSSSPEGCDVEIRIKVKSVTLTNIGHDLKADYCSEAMDDFIVTRGAILKRNADKDFVAVTYTAPKKKHKSIEVNPKAVALTGMNARRSNSRNQSKELEAQDVRRQQDVEMKRARFDVIKFGMSGFDGAKGEEAKINLAIKLGAKPPKKKGKNYKELILERQKKKAEAKKQEEISELGKNLVKRSAERKRRRKEPGLLSTYGVVKTTKATITNNKRRP